MLFFSDIGAITRSFAIMLFIFLTAPVAAHMLGRASYFEDLPMWKGTKINELKGKYCKKTHKIYSHDIENEEECQD
jgi:multicomponent Na+:H+ antiporter subunit G